MVVSLIF